MAGGLSGWSARLARLDTDAAQQASAMDKVEFAIESNKAGKDRDDKAAALARELQNDERGLQRKLDVDIDAARRAFAALPTSTTIVNAD